MKYINYVIVLLFTFVFTSCATIVNGRSPLITIGGGMKNQRVTIATDKEIMQNVRLPYTVAVKSHGIEGKRIKVIAEDGSYPDIVLRKKVNPWVFGNIIIGGLVGVAVDFISNKVVLPATTTFMLDPETFEKDEVITEM